MAVTTRFGLPPIRSTGAKLAIVLVVASAIWALLYNLAEVSLYLRPNDVLSKWQLWQLITFLPAEIPGSGVRRAPE